MPTLDNPTTTERMLRPPRMVAPPIRPMVLQVRQILWFLLFTAAAVQCVLSEKAANFACVGMVVVGSLIVWAIVLKKYPFEVAPISSLLVLYFSITGLLVPLVETTLEGKELIYKLHLPIKTFGYTSLAAVVLAFSHLLYRRSPLAVRPPGWVAQHVLELGELFRIPSTGQLWLIGFVGSGALAAEGFLFSKTVIDVSGFIPQLVHGFTSFSAAPLLIPILARFNRAVVLKKSYWVGISLYLAVISCLAMAVNARAVFAAPVATTVLGFSLAMLIERFKFNILSGKNIVIFLVGFFVVLPLLENAATAMRVVRGERNYTSGGDMIALSIEVMFDPEKLERANNIKNNALVNAGEWDERYLNNEFAQRFTPIKFTDNSLYYTDQYSEVERVRLADFAKNRFYSLFPSPVLKALGIDFNKWAYLRMSYGDFIYEGRNTTYAAFRTGSLIATGIAINGWSFYLYFTALGILTFFLFDCFAKPAKYVSQQGKTITYLIISPAFLISAYSFVSIYSTEAMSTSAVILIRALPQACVLYWLLFQVTKIARR